MRWIARFYRVCLCVVAMVCFDAITCAQLAAQTSAVTGDESDAATDSPEKDYAAELPRIPSQSPEEELGSFEVLPGFTVELVAAEPLVTDPVAFAFDGRGRLFVVEMNDYSEQETESLGSIALLTDRDSDGKMDERSTFVSGLSWPTAIWPWRDGVIVAEPPRLTWFRDTNSDGKSDTFEVWFEGFQRSNVQGLVNSLRWGVDGFLHGATSSSGADIVARDTAQTKLQLRGRDFAIDPLTETLEPESGGGQHGMNFNRWGDKFVTSNSDHLQQVSDLDRWLSDHPANVAIPSLRRSIAEDGPQAEVFRASPIEPWRIVRTRLRKSGVAPGIVEGGGRAAGYFTGATATLIMDHEAGFGSANFDTAIVCDVGSNLVHRKQLRSNGLFWTASRIDDQAELLRSSDIWFRPVQLGDGPDGAVYIADMYREVIEHPKSLPPMIKKHLDLTSGRDKGRIWRLKPKDLAQRLPVPSKSIAECTNRELVERLSSVIAWQRRAASQALVERNAQDVAPELKSLVAKSDAESSVAAQILALHCLHRLGQLDRARLAIAMKSADPYLQRHAIALARQTGLADSMFDVLQSLSQSTDASVQLQLALTAADLPHQQRLELLQGLMHSRESLVRAVIVTAAGIEAPQLIAGRRLEPPELQAWLELMLPAWTKTTGDQAKQISQALIAGLSDDAMRPSWIVGLRSLPTASDARRLLALADSATAKNTLAFIADSIAEVQGLDSSDSVAWLGLLDEKLQLQFADDLLMPAQSETIQLAAIDSLLWANPNVASQLLIDRFQSFTPTLQQASLNGLLRYQSALPTLATAIAEKKIRTAQVPPDIRVRLLSTSDKTLAKRFAGVLQSVAADRQAIIDQYSTALVARDAQAGREVFKRVCAQCHRLDEMGNDVGPPLKQLADKSPQQLLETILDPNREVDPKYAGYSVLLQDGRVFAGIIAEESSSQIVLAEAGGKKHTLARSEIEQLRSAGISLMPTGLEQQITPEQMSQLIGFLKNADHDRN